MTTFLNTFREVARLSGSCSDDGIRFYHSRRGSASIVVETNVHPGFMTDRAAALAVAPNCTQGLVHRSRDRVRTAFWLHGGALRKMGATIQASTASAWEAPSARFRSATLIPAVIWPCYTARHRHRRARSARRSPHLIAALAAEGISKQVEG